MTIPSLPAIPIYRRASASAAAKQTPQTGAIGGRRGFRSWPDSNSALSALLVADRCTGTTRCRSLAIAPFAVGGHCNHSGGPTRDAAEEHAPWWLGPVFQAPSIGSICGKRILTPFLRAWRTRLESVASCPAR